MGTEMIFFGIIIAVVVIVFIIFRAKKYQSDTKEPQNQKEEITVAKESVEALAEYVRIQKEQAEAEQRLKELKKAELKQKLETFKQTKDTLKEKLKTQIDQKEWKPLDKILKNTDKGVVGIYIIYNATKDKYYVGQAKQIIQRIKKHFQVEDMTKDFLNGDTMSVKFLTANELGDDYRLDHVEKTGIEIFNSDKTGYNKTTGNL